MYLVILSYTQPLAEVGRHVPAHREFLDRCYAAGELLVSGPQEPRTGGIFVFRGMPEEQLLALLSEDPFKLAGVAEYKTIRFTPTRHVPQIAGLLEAAGALA